MCKWYIAVVAVVAGMMFFEVPVTMALERVAVKPIVEEKA